MATPKKAEASSQPSVEEIIASAQRRIKEMQDTVEELLNIDERKRRLTEKLTKQLAAA